MAWQSKAGNIGHSDWRNLVGQLDELRQTRLGHGSFDLSLPRRPVLVTTGRLTGNAPDLFRDYNERAREKSEPELELWDRDILTGFLVDNPDAVLRGSTDGHFLSTLGSAAEGSATMPSIEIFSRRWMTWEPERIAGLGVVEASLLGERLAAEGRLDLACHLSLCLLRGTHAAGAPPAATEGAADLFEAYATQLWEECQSVALDEGFVHVSGGSAWVTYSVRCTRIAEIVGLLALRQRGRDASQADELANWLVRFVGTQPGTVRPISDLYGVCLVPAVLAVAQVDLGAAKSALTKAAIWLCDAYQVPRLGLAPVSADQSEEVERLLGGPLEWVDRERRRDSNIATILLDLASALCLGDLYADIRNDLEAVRVYPRILRIAQGPDLFDREGMGNRLDPNVDFAPDLTDDAVAPHHLDKAGRDLCSDGGSWNLLAISSALRDRTFYCTLEHFSEGSR
jgi:hypothetical protein